MRQDDEARARCRPSTTSSTIRAEATCHLCGMPGSWTDPVDPLTADHVVPRAEGGRWSELLPAHRSCNARRGASLDYR